MAQRKAHKFEDRERTEDIHVEENVDFAGMYLSDQVLEGLKASGFERPSPIQLAAIPLGRCGLDLVVQAKSGTGKTCVFTVVALEMISVAAVTTQVLVMAPTREIAVQITQVVSAVGSRMPGLRAATFIGGINLAQDRAKLRRCHIAVGTPGRIAQLVELGYLKLDNVRLFILDEADQLLTGQFTESVVRLASALPLNKQILALSATYTEEVAEVAERLMRSPNHVRLGRESPALLGVNQFVRLLPYHHQPHRRQQIKIAELLSILTTVTFNQCLVFSNSQLRAESLCNALRASGWPVSYLTGAQTQSDRLQALEELCSYKCRILVSTDLSARGLDSEHVNLVVNLDMPRNQATYLHRVGRAGRFGSRGGAVTIATEGDEWQAMKAIATLANVKVYLLQEEWESTIASKDVEGMEELELLSDEDAKIWFENNCVNVYDRKLDKSSKQVLEQEKNLDSNYENDSKMKSESFEDSGKENREAGAVSKKQSRKSKKMMELKENDHTYNGDIKADKKKSWKGKDGQNKNIDKEGFKKREEEAKVKLVNEKIKAENHRKVLTLLQGINPKSPSVSMSYSDMLSECLDNYDRISAADNPVVRVPPLPNKLKPTEVDIKALDDHWKATQEEHEQRIIEADKAWICSGADAKKALQDVIEGKEVCTLSQGKAGCSTMNDQTSGPLSRENDSFPLEGLNAKGSGIYTKNKDDHPSSPCAQIASSSSDDAIIDQKKRVTETLPFETDYSRQNMPTSQHDEGLKKYECNMNAKNMEQPKIKKQAKKKMHSKRHTSSNNQYKSSAHHRYWGHWDYETMNGSQYQTNYPGHQTRHNDEQQQGYYFGYQGSNPVDPQRGNHQEFRADSTSRGKDYKDIHTDYMDTYYSSTSWNLRSYIKSANKFASMMDYVQTMGRMSAWMARDFYARNNESTA